MIKLFRHFRKNLIEQNKMGKYFKYAIGEILLVVIGILIALQINNWNTENTERKLEVNALKNLKEDFLYNLKELEEVILTNDKNINSCLLILKYTGKRYSQDFNVDKVINDAMSAPDYYPKNGFLNDLINSGNLGILKNDLLRNRLSSWKPAIETMKNRQEAAEEFDQELIKYVFKNGSWLNVDQIIDSDLIANINLPESGFSIDNNAMLKSLEFENRIENQAVFFSILKERYNDCLQLNKEILKLLESELINEQ